LRGRGRDKGRGKYRREGNRAQREREVRWEGKQVGTRRGMEGKRRKGKEREDKVKSRILAPRVISKSRRYGHRSKTITKLKKTKKPKIWTFH